MPLAQEVNVLRAGMTGANNRIILIAGIVIGVAATTSNAHSILIAGLSETLAGMISACIGEYISVSTQKDSQRVALTNEKQRPQNQHQHESDYVRKKYEAQDTDSQLAKQATKELMGKDASGTAVQGRYGFNLNEFTSPYTAVIVSSISFPAGSTLPMVAITVSLTNVRILATAIAVLIALLITSHFAAVLGKSNRIKSIARNAATRLLTMGIVHLIG